MGAMRRMVTWAMVLALLGSIGAGVGIQATHRQDETQELSDTERIKLEKQAAELNRQIGEHYQKRRFDEAIRLSEQLLATYRQLYPTDSFPDGHRNLANCLYNLGTLLKARGELDKAEHYYRDALAMRQRLYPRDTL